MRVLVINSGSSSIKYQLFNMLDNSVLAKGLVERIGIPGSLLTHYPVGKDSYRSKNEISDHGVALHMIFEALTDRVHGVLENVDEINAIGHRVVHGGEIFKHSVIVREPVKEDIRALSQLAPLHNPANLLGITACERAIPGVKQVAVFDTSFHSTIPRSAYMYGIPYEYYEKYRVRKYGFHGTSHQYVSQRAAAMLGRPLEDLKLISCHLGSGSSITAISGGRSIDTSMGMTPLEGVVMGTRCGDLDPAIIPFLMERENLIAEEINSIMNNKSGVLGLSGISSDFRDIEKAADEGNERARLAIEVFIHRVKKYIGAYVTELNGIDGLIFTAGLGENSADIRAAICDGLDYLQIWIDPEKNDVRGVEAKISTSASKASVLIIPTNEELMIASETVKTLNAQ